MRQRQHGRLAEGAEQIATDLLVPIPLADQWFKQGTITRLFDEELVADSSYYLVWDEDRKDDESVRRLRSWILQKFTSEG